MHCVLLLAIAFLSIAWGKGGGHGGGGHGGRRKSQPPSYQRHYRDTGSWLNVFRVLNPFGCINLPSIDERIEVLTSVIDRKGVYKNAIVVEKAGRSCVFTARLLDEQQQDESNTRSVFHLSTPPNWIVHVIICFFGAHYWFKTSYQRNHDRQAIAFDEAYQRFFLEDDDTESTSLQPAGYEGVTDESDGTCQRVRVHLDFCPEKRVVTGRGSDERDGDYTVKGSYYRGRTNGAVKWTEKYIQGFTVEVRGTWQEEQLNCFLSSRGITGTVVLRKGKTVKEVEVH